MKKEVLERRAKCGETAKILLDMLKEKGPMTLDEARKRSGKDVKTSLFALERKGLVRSFVGANENSGGRYARTTVKFFELVKNPINQNLAKYIRALEMHGYKVIPPSKNLMEDRCQSPEG